MIKKQQPSITEIQYHHMLRSSNSHRLSITRKSINWHIHRDRTLLLSEIGAVQISLAHQTYEYNSFITSNLWRSLYRPASRPSRTGRWIAIISTEHHRIQHQYIKARFLYSTSEFYNTLFISSPTFWVNIHYNIVISKYLHIFIPMPH